jgi:outer membrane protein OmpA-like peptidoglycan-associated protein
MHSRQLHSLSRILLISCAVGLGTTGLLAQRTSNSPASSSASDSGQTPSQSTSQDSTSSSAPAAAAQTPAAAPSAPQAPYASRLDIFLGYSYLAPHGSVLIPGGANVGLPNPVSYSSINTGAIGSASYYFNRYVGAQAEYSNHPDGANDGAQIASGGIVFRYPTQDITPFVHAEAGAVRLGGPFKQPYTWGPALTLGGGLDYGVTNHFAVRVFQADYQYYHVNFGPQFPFPTGGRANVDAVRLSAGLVYRLGNITPPPPVTYQCAASPASVYPGDPVTVTGTAANLNPKKNATYTWTGNNGVKVTGDSNTGQLDTSGLNPGSYTVTGHVSEGQKPGQFADCTANFEVKQFEPPTISCSAAPTTLKPGDSATITAQGVSPQNRPLTYTYSASAGQINGTDKTATLATSGAPAGPITVTCNVADDKGQTASTTTTVNIENPPPPPQPHTQTLCSINFDRDKKRPARVDNEAKACLDDVALNLQRQSDATAVVVGDSASGEKSGPKLAAQRAVNTKQYLVTEKGIDASRVQVRSGSETGKQAQNYLVPAGANFDGDVQGTQPIDENSVKPQTRAAAPAHHHHHKKAAAQQ